MKINSLRRKLAGTLATLIATLLVNVPSTRAEMVFVSAFRSITGEATQMESMGKSTDSLGVFNDEFINTDYVREQRRVVGTVTTSASQSSLISEHKIRGFGRGSGFATGLEGEAAALGQSKMNVVFDVDETMKYTLSGVLRITPHGLGLNGSTAYVRLMGPKGPVFDVSMTESSISEEGVVSFSDGRALRGEFEAGRYELQAFAEGQGADRMTRCADFDFDFSVIEASAVPEPTSFVLGGIAFAPWLALRLRRSRQAP